jgi:hypothetical protein
VEVRNYTVDSFDSVADFFPFIPTGDYKLVFSFQSSISSKFFYQIEVIVNFKGVTTRKGQ